MLRREGVHHNQMLLRVRPHDCMFWGLMTEVLQKTAKGSNADTSLPITYNMHWQYLTSITLR